MKPKNINLKIDKSDLSGDQKKALLALMSWYKAEGKAPYITMGGYAGTGKTTLISILRQDLGLENKKLKVAFASYTGKATRVLRQTIQRNGSLFDKDSCGTIHSLIYSPIENDKMEIIGWKLKEELEKDLIIIDEASMVDFNIWRDLTSFGVPIIAVGDHGQLPPIRENFNLMEKPVLKLEEIHRQAKGNPIIELSMIARLEGKIKPGIYGKNIKKLDRLENDSQETVNELLNSYNSDLLVLCGYNNTRIRLNNFIRQNLGYEGQEPQIGDRVICLRNNHAEGIFNGMLGQVKSINTVDGDWYDAEIEMDGEDEIYNGFISKAQFNKTEGMNFTKERYKIMKGDLFDFGYALTVHKAQGSQAKRVVLFEERFSKMDDDMWRRWLYTGITRAEEELFIIG